MRFFLCAFLFCFEAFGGTPTAPPSATAIPFEYCEGLLWIQVQVPQSTQPLNFLFDTGAGVSVINAGTARTLGLKTGNRITVQGGHQRNKLLIPCAATNSPINNITAELT